jgi:penicillin amidase
MNNKTVIESFSKTSTITVYRDDYGAPHIFSQEIEGLFYGFGYATAQDRLFQMELIRLFAWGESVN